VHLVRIALLSPYSWTYPGGVTRHIESLARELNEAGHDARILAPFDPDDALSRRLHRGARPQRHPTPERFVSLLVMNTTLGTGDQPLSQGFLAWRDFSNRNPDMDIARLMQRACPHLTPAEAAAYAAPYPDSSHKAGVRRFPNLVPNRPDAPGAALSREARAFWRERWTGRSLMAIGMADPVLGPPVMRALHADIRNCPPPIEIADGGHFLQEWGGPIARAALKAL